MSTRMYGHHPLLETLGGMALALLTVLSIATGFFVSLFEIGRYLRMKRL